VDAGGPVDAGGLMDAGRPVDAGSTPDAGLLLDAGPFLPPSNFQLSQLPQFLVPAHYDLNCSGTIALNNNLPVFTSDNALCFGPLLPPSTRVSQGAGLPELVLFAMDRLTIRSGVTLRFAPGFASSPGVVPVFAVRGDAVIEGTIDVSALPGPGRRGARNNGVGAGSAFCAMNTSGATASRNSGGGAGGSFGLVGGTGGRGSSSSTVTGGAGGTPGAANGNETLTPLRGGCAGSAGGDAADGFGRAGGAVQVWAQGALRVTGRVLAAGGPGTIVSGTIGAGGGGGGAGGGILLEGRTVAFGATSVVAANGGSGAEGNGTNNTGLSGAYGSFDVTPAAGGAGGAQCGGSGGAGGARGVAGSTGIGGGLEASCVLVATGGGGGGGGGAGRVRINSLSGCTVASGARFSPQATSAQPSCAP
ncbi:MAG: hypothetical protein INH41_00705, partial [Myxococcaceae bacterium]|nr:hypothetical protein [Myxococcaceae bacterium]